MGNQAFAHAALEAGVRVVAGYPGTPSSEVVETIAKLHEQGAAQGVHVEWSTNEKAALELLAGASYAGARTLFTCKQMGMNVASDPLLCVNYVGIQGGMVLYVADDPGPISSQTEQDTRRYASFAKVPVLDPSTPEQGFAMIKEAFELSERYHTPVIVRPTTRICHASAFFEVAEHTIARAVPEEGFVRDSKWVIFPARSLAAHHDINKRLPEMGNEFSQGWRAATFNPVESGGWGNMPCTSSANDQSTLSHNARLGIVAGGMSAAYAREALKMIEKRAAEQGIAVPACRLMQIGLPFPFPSNAVLDFAQGLTDVLVLEELDSVLEDELLRLAGLYHLSYTVHGRVTGEVRAAGENDVDDIASRLANYLGVPSCAPSRPSVVYESNSNPPPMRPPVLCPGCPHRGSFYAVKRALGKTPAIYCGDIGCYTLGNAKPLNAVDTCLCMGAGITMAQGLSVADPNKKALAFIGDSTFFASGMTGVANAVYNRHDITIIVLDNATTAMTGAQPHPGTGQTLMGPKSTPISIAHVLETLGVQCIETANPLHLEESIAAAQKAISFEGPSAVIFVEPCVQLKKPSEPAHIDTQLCTGCKKCITEIGCPGIAFDTEVRGLKSAARGQAFVDMSLCNGCGLCTQVCPSTAISLTVSGSAQPKKPTGLNAHEQADALLNAQEKQGGVHD